MAVGILNPRDVSNSSNIRPADVLSGVNERRWFLSGALFHPQDVNMILAQLRTAYDAYAIADVEGDDTALQQIFDKMLLKTGGEMTGNLALRLAAVPITFSVNGEANTRVILGRHTDAAGGPLVLLRKARGSIAAAALMLQNDLMGTLDFAGVTDITDPTNPTYTTGVRIQTSVTAASPGPSDMGSRYVMTMIPGGSVSLSEILRLEHATGLSMFGANPVIDNNRHFRLRSYTIATLPSASPAGQLIRISDMGPAGALSQSDGSAWRAYLGGVYTPTATKVTNLDTATAASAQYTRVGNIVTVSGQIAVDATATGQALLRMSLPFTSALTGDGECCGAGTVFESASSILPVLVGADTTNDQVTMTWVAAGTGAGVLNYTFTYRVV